MKLRVFRNTIIVVLIIITAILMTACGGNKSDKSTIRIGSKDFTESLVVAEIYALFNKSSKTLTLISNL